MKLIVAAGDVFGQLTLVRKLGHPLYLFSCTCGNEHSTSIYSVAKGATQSCGCLRRKVTGNRRKSHGMSESSTYQRWAGMVQRCTNQNSDQWRHYGGRGIAIDPSWLSFSAFVADMGECPSGYSLERVNVNGNYCKANCKWIPLRDQKLNTRRSVLVTLNGTTKNLSTWCQELNFDYNKARDRVARGWAHDRVFS